MTLMILVGCGLLVLFIHTAVIECLALVKIGLMGPEMSVNNDSQPVFLVTTILQVFSQNTLVNSVQIFDALPKN